MLAYGIPGEKAVNFLKASDLFQYILSSDDIDNLKKNQCKQVCSSKLLCSKINQQREMAVVVELG